MRIGRSLGRAVADWERRNAARNAPSCPGGMVTRAMVEDLTRTVGSLEVRVNLLLGVLLVGIVAELLRWFVK